MVNREYCLNCHQETSFKLVKSKIKKVIKNEAMTFELTKAICNKCGKEIKLPELIEINHREIDEQYRKSKDLVSINDLLRLMKIYNIGKNPLSIVLGFGEITITRYLDGQMPSKEYSDVVKHAIVSPDFMLERLKASGDKISNTSYEKAYQSAIELQKAFNLSLKLKMVIKYIFEQMGEVSPMMLQKLLYFIQAISLGINSKAIFEEKCVAAISGPIYLNVYKLFKDFKYSPLDDERFVIFEKIDLDFSQDEQQIIDSVLETFGLFSDKALEEITANESPWLEARSAYNDSTLSYDIISQTQIENYYQELNAKYDFSKNKGLMAYILSN